MALGRGEKGILVLGGIVVVCAGVKLAAPVLAPFVLALFIATVTWPLVRFLRRLGVPPLVAVAIALVVDLGGVALLGWLAATSAAAFAEKLPAYQARLADDVVMVEGWLARAGIPVPPDGLGAALDPARLSEATGDMLRGMAGVVSDLVLVLVIVGFLLIEALDMRRKLAKLITGPERVERFCGATREVNKYLVVKTLTSLATGILCAVWCAAWGVDLPVLWGILAFLLNFVPWVGHAVATVPPVLLAFIEHGPGPTAAVAAGYIFIGFVIGSLVEPRVLGRALGLSPLAVLLSILLWGFLLGPVGALVAVPLTMLVRVFLADTEDLRFLATLLGPAPPPPPPPSRDPVVFDLVEERPVADL